MTLAPRKLETRDIWAIAKIIRGCQPDVLAALDVARRGSNGTQLPFAQVDWEALGVPLIFSLLEQADTNLRALLASLAGVEPDELDAWPPADTFALVAEVVAQEDWASFLEPLSKMLSIRAPIATASSPATAGTTSTLEPLAPSATPKRRKDAA